MARSSSPALPALGLWASKRRRGTVVSTVVVETTGGSVQRRARLQATLIRYSVLIRDAKLGGPMSSTWLLNRTFVGYFYAVVGPSIYTPGSRQGGVSIYPERCTQCRWRMLNGRVSKAWPYLVKSALLPIPCETPNVYPGVERSLPKNKNKRNGRVLILGMTKQRGSRNPSIQSPSPPVLRTVVCKFGRGE